VISHGVGVIVGVDVLVGVREGRGVAVLVAVVVAISVAVWVAVDGLVSSETSGVGYRGWGLTHPVNVARQKVAKMIPIIRFMDKIIPILGVTGATKALAEYQDRVGSRSFAYGCWI